MSIVRSPLLDQSQLLNRRAGSLQLSVQLKAEFSPILLNCMEILP